MRSKVNICVYLYVLCLHKIDYYSIIKKQSMVYMILRLYNDCEGGYMPLNIGKRIKALRKNKNITMDELFNYKIDSLNYKERFIIFMLDNGVLEFGKFKLHSGRISPYIINSSNYKTCTQITKLKKSSNQRLIYYCFY